MKNKNNNIKIEKEGFRNYVALIDGEKIESTRTYNPNLAEIRAKNFLKNLKKCPIGLDKTRII